MIYATGISRGSHQFLLFHSPAHDNCIRRNCNYMNSNPQLFVSQKKKKKILQICILLHNLEFLKCYDLFPISVWKWTQYLNKLYALVPISFNNVYSFTLMNTLPSTLHSCLENLNQHLLLHSINYALFPRLCSTHASEGGH